jgi:hypothetical protein
MSFHGIMWWQFVLVYFECGAAALAIGWWWQARKTIVIKRKPKDFE